MPNLLSTILINDNKTRNVYALKLTNYTYMLNDKTINKLYVLQTLRMEGFEKK